MQKGNNRIIVAVYVDDLFILTEDDDDQTLEWNSTSAIKTKSQSTIHPIN